MKIRTFGAFLTAVFGLAFLPATGQVPAGADYNPPDSGSAPEASVRPSGSSEVLKLVRAGISQEVVVAYINSSGQSFNLSAGEIIRLKEQGVTDPVLNAMLQQSEKAATTASAPPPSGTSAPQYAPYTPAATTAYPYSSYSYYPYYPYYGYYGYGYPAVSLSFGFGGYYGYPYRGYYGGCYSGGYYRGGWGGYHGGHGLSVTTHGGGGHGGRH